MQSRRGTLKDYDYVDSAVPGLRLKKCVFLHIQKTAGTTLQGTARQIFGNEGVWSHGDCYLHTMEEAAKVGFLSGHFGSVYASRFSARRYYLTFLRDPIKRILSLYRYLRTSDVAGSEPLQEFARSLSLADFLERAMNSENYIYVDNVQAWQLAHGWGPEQLHGEYRDQSSVPKEEMLQEATAALEQMDFVGFTESASRDSRKVLKDLGWSTPLIQNYNHTPEAAPKQSLTRRETELLLRLTDVDRKVYLHAIKLRHGSMAAAGWRLASRFRTFLN